MNDGMWDVSDVSIEAGYDEAQDDFLVKTVTYSHYRWISLRDLWNTGFHRRGGFVLFKIN